MALSPVTKLEAVNRMLHDLGDRPVNTLTGATRLDVVRAINSIDQTRVQLLNAGWWFNTETVDVSVDGANNYPITDDISHIEVVSGGPTTSTSTRGVMLVVRGRKLYDVNNATDQFVGAPTVTLKVHRLLEFEDLPSSVREYVYTAASIRNQSRTLGSKNVDQDLKLQAASAFGIMHEENIDAQEFDATYSNTFLDLMHNR